MEEEKKIIVGIVGAWEEPSEDRIERCRKKSIELHKKYNKGKPANLWVCNAIPEEDEVSKPFKKGKCHKCKGVVIYDPTAKKNLKKGAKKICKLCVIKIEEKNPGTIEPEMYKYIERSMN